MHHALNILFHFSLAEGGEVAVLAGVACGVLGEGNGGVEDGADVADEEFVELFLTVFAEVFDGRVGLLALDVGEHGYDGSCLLFADDVGVAVGLQHVVRPMGL